MRFSDANQVEFVFFSLTEAPACILPCPYFPANYVFQTGHWNLDPEHFAFSCIPKKILITRIGCELDIEFTAGTLRIGSVFKSDSKSDCLEFALNLRKIRCDHHKIDIHRVNRFNVTIHCQPANQTPRFISIQHGDDFREIARAAVRYRFIDFSRGHVSLQITERQTQCQLAAPVNRRRLNLACALPLQLAQISI